MPKRQAKTVQQEGAEEKCIIHYQGIKCTRFTKFSELQDPDERFRSICGVRDVRLGMPPDSVNRQQHICDQIPMQYEELQGYHRECYQRFTMNTKRLKPSDGAEESEPAKRARRSSSAEGKDRILFTPDCIFCGSEKRKKVRVKNTWTTEALSSFSHGGGTIIIQIAEERKDEDLARRIRGVDLFAAEAKYHSSCRKKYVDRTAWRSKDEEAKKLTLDLEKTHDLCFATVCAEIDRRIIVNKEVMKLSDLRDFYVAHLSETEFSNPDYRTEKLKSKLVSHELYGNKLCFVGLDRQGGKFQSELVFSCGMDISTAVKNGYMLGCSDEVGNVARLLHGIIGDAFANASKLPWPPTAANLQAADDPVPENLQRFLRILISGQNCVGKSGKIERLISSIGQDLCRAATKGRWKLQKHILVCMTLRHLFRSAQLSTLMNRLGHAESYSFSLELETALAEALHEASSLLTPEIIRNPTSGVFHSDFDNFDQFVNDLSGSGSVHTAHGIMLQDVPPGASVETNDPVLPSAPKTKARSLKPASLGSDSLPPCYVSQRDSPTMKITHLTIPEGVLSSSDEMNRTWCIVRRLSSMEGQLIPGWGGFVSETGVAPARLTTIDYYPVINHPITENSTVQECLRVSKDSSDQVGQKYAITTFDLGVCMKAYPILWKNPTVYKDHIVMIGTFHVICAYLKMVGKKMAGSGFSDILLESGLMSSGSLEGVTSGKNYSRAIHCHKAMVEALERLLLQSFDTTRNTERRLGDNPETKEKLDKLLKDRNKDSLAVVMDDPNFHSYLAEYSEFRAGVKKGDLGKTAMFWVSYMDHIWLILHLLKAVKTNDYYLYSACLHEMANLFFSYDGQNYARYLSYFSVFLANIEQTHPGATDLLKQGAISVARSFIPGNRCAVDKTIEETFMKHAKSHGGAGGRGAGVSGILMNYAAYKRWARTAHERSRYVDVTLQMADMTDANEGGHTHRDVRPSQIRKSELATVKVIKSVQSFMNPFDVEDLDQLLCLASGAPVAPDVTEDILGAEGKGAQSRDEFVAERLMKNKDFFKPIKRQKLKTFEDMNKKVVVKTSKLKELEYHQQGNVAFQLLVLSQNRPEKLDLKEVLRYPLMPVPSSIGTADGYLLKTDKSKGFHHLTRGTKDAPPQPEHLTLNIEDGNATFYCMKEVPRTFNQIGLKLLDMTTTGHTNVIFSTDMYKEDSVKSMERSRRGCGEKRIVQGENTRRPDNWKDFLTNDENKQQLVRLLLKVWSSQDCAPKLRDKEVIAICEGKAYRLTSDGKAVTMLEVPALESDQEETDTRVVLYCSYAESQKCQTVRVRSPDSDIYFILLYYAPTFGIQILFDTGSGDHRRLIDVSEMAKDFMPTYCSSLLGLHAFTRCDTTSAFKGIGKVKPIKLLQEKPRYQEIFAQLGEKWQVSDELFAGLEDFTCRMYKKTGRISDIDELRYVLLMSKCGGNKGELRMKRKVDLASLPPPKKCLEEHVKRVNYQVGIWKRAHVPSPEIPDPTDDHGWRKSGAQSGLEPQWCIGDVIPPKMADILEKQQEQGSDDDDDDDDNSDVDSENDSDVEEDSSSSSDSDW